MSTLLALLPILWLVIALAVLKLPAWKACSLAAIIAFVIAVVPFAKSPGIIFSGALEGAALAIWPILLVITAAIFTYNLVVYTKAMDTIKTMLSSVTSDKRILALLLAWGFGAFMEGMAGFGTAVAIPAAMMVAVGFDPLKSIIACLVANSVPTTFGSIAIPTTTLASLTNLDPVHLGTFISSQLFLLNVLTPFFIVIIIGGGLKALKGVFLITLLSGLALAVPELLINAVIGPELSVMIPSIIIMGVIILGAKLLPVNDPEYQVKSNVEKISFNKGLIATVPFILIVIFLVASSKLVPGFHAMLASVKTSVQIYQGPGAKPYTFVWIATPGIMIFLAAFIGGAIQKAKLSEMLNVLKTTFLNLKWTYVTIITVVMTAKIMTYSGMITAIATALVGATGAFYPMFAPLVGALGGFLTGSGTNSNVLFGPLQMSAAKAMAPDYKDLPMWLAAINSGAAGIGKMLSPQSIAISIGAVAPALEAYIKANKINDAKAKELQDSIQANRIMMSVLKYFIIFLIISGVVSHFGHAFINVIKALFF